MRPVTGNVFLVYRWALCLKLAQGESPLGWGTRLMTRRSPLGAFLFLWVVGFLADPTWAQSGSSPSISLSSSQSEVASGKSVSISWTVVGAQECVASGAWSGVYTGSQAERGRVTSAPLSNRVNVFTLRCTGTGGASERSVTVSAVPKPSVTLVADPTTVLPGESVLLRWSSEDASSCTGSGPPFTGSKGLSGSETLSGLTKGNKKFSLSCKGVGGTTKDTVEVSVTAAPTLSFTARATQIGESQSTQLKWKATDATSCVASGDWSGLKGTSGTSQTNNLTSDKTYTLTCSGPNGEVSQTVRVEVVAAPEVTLDLDQQVVAPGEEVTIRWSVTDAQSCKASGNPFTGDKSITGGSETLSNLTRGTKRFRLTCRGGGGSTTAEATLQVVPLPTLEFTARKSEIKEGESASLRWRSKDATSCEASGDWEGPQSLSGSLTTAALSSDRSYTLTCAGPNGEVSETVAVAVIPAPVIRLELSEPLVEPGEDVTVEWDTEYAQSCRASGGSWSGTKSTSGSETLRFSSTGRRIFTLSCSGVGGTREASVDLRVFPRPEIVSFEADPLRVQAGQSTTLRWQTRSADTCVASGAWSGNQSLSSSGLKSAPLAQRNNEFVLSCRNEGGEAVARVTVEVEDAPQVSLSIDPALLAQGEQATLRWSSEGASACRASGAWTGNKALLGSEPSGALNAGDYTYTLTCTNAVGSDAKTVSAKALVPKASISTGRLSFGELGAGGSLTRDLALQNAGAVNLRYTSATLTGTDADQFAVSANCPTALVSEATCAISVTFRPSTAGSKSAQLQIRTSAPETIIVELTGRAAFFPLSVTFQGSGGGQVSSAPSGLSCTSNCTANFNSGTTVTLTATANSTSTFEGWSGACLGTTPTCTLTLSEARNTTARFNGRTPAVELSASTLNFGSQAISSSSAAQTLTVKNSGQAALTISAVTLDGPDAGQFAQTHTCTSVAIGESCTVSVVFRPSGAGSRSASIQLASNAPGSPHIVTLAGIGIVSGQERATRAYVSNFSSNNISVIDTATNAVLATVPVGENPGGVAVSPDGGRIYVPNTNSNNVSVIDSITNTVTATIAVGTVPSGVTFNPAGSRAYVANSGTDNVSVIDTASNAVIASIPVRDWPANLVVNAAGNRLYVANYLSNTVTVISTETNSVVATVNGLGTRPRGIAINPFGTRLYVPNGESKSVSVIDTESNSVVATVPVGTSPAAVAINATGDRVYVANYSSNTVSVIDTSTNLVVAVVPVGRGPHGVATSPDGSRVFVANRDSGNISVISAVTNTVISTAPAGSLPVGIAVGFARGVSLTVTKSGTGTGTVSSNPVAIDCGNVCSFEFALGRSITLTAVAASGSSFAGWSGACSGSDSVCTVTMSEARSVDAKFEPARVSLLTVSPRGTGAGEVISDPVGIRLVGADCRAGQPGPNAACGAEFPVGSKVTLTVVKADSNSVFKGWGGACSGTGGTCTVEMTESKSVTVGFDLVSAVRLTLLPGGTGAGAVETVPAGISLVGADCRGGISGASGACSADFPLGSAVTVKVIKPDSNSIFEGWQGACSGTESTCTVTMDQPKSITAKFSMVVLAVTKSGSGAGTVSSVPAGIDCGGSCLRDFTVGTTVTLTAAPSSASVFEGWGGACGGTSLTCTVTMSQSRNVSAVFGVKPAGSSIAKFDFNEMAGGNAESQYQTGTPIRWLATSSIWSGGGINAHHVLQVSSVEKALMIFSGYPGQSNTNTATLKTPIPANAANTTYRVDFDVAPTVNSNPNQTTTSAERIVIRVVDNNGQIVGQTEVAPGVWPAANVFARKSFTYTGQGTGDVRLIVTSGTVTSRFAGAVDNIEVSTFVPGLTVDRSGIDFSSRIIGSSTSEIAVTLKNESASTISLNGISLGGLNADQFIQTNACPASLSAGATCSVSLTFRPTSAGSKVAILAIRFGNPDTTLSVALSGVGESAPDVLDFSPTSVVFGEQAVGTTASARIVTVTNRGANVLPVPTIVLGGSHAADFIQSSSCISTLLSNSSCQIEVGFRPTAAGTRAATLTINFPVFAVAAEAPTVVSSGFVRPLTPADITNSSTQRFWSDGARIYECSNDWVSWTNARAAAANRSIGGLQGYLATITSAAENAFVVDSVMSLCTRPYFYLGASDAEVEGVWRWVTGPEAGTQFAAANGSSFNGRYSRLQVSNPAEDYIYIAKADNGGWGDMFDFDGGLATGYLVEYDSARAAFKGPVSVAADSAGTIYVADIRNHRVHKISGGTTTVVAGTGVAASTGDGGQALAATLNLPVSIAIDSANNLYVAEEGSGRIRKIQPNGIISTLATGLNVSKGGALHVDNASSTLFVAVFGEVKRIALSTGNVSTFVSTGSNRPTGMTTDPSGNVYLLEVLPNASGRLTKYSSTGQSLGVVAGVGETNVPSGDGGPATAANLNEPHDVEFDRFGNLFIVEDRNVRQIDSDGTITTLAQNVYGFGMAIDRTGRLIFGGRDVVQQLNLSYVGRAAPATITLTGEGTLPGTAASTAVRSVDDLVKARPGIASGVYWFDPDGAGGNAPFQTYADTTTAGGGWLQVRRVAGSGGWYPLSDNLVGESALNPQFSSEKNAATSWSVKFDYFVNATTDYLLATGDGSVWCVIKRGTTNFDGVVDFETRRSRVVESSGTAVTSGGTTNVLLRPGSPEDPWIGCEGTHQANTFKMLYGEGGYSVSPHNDLKNSRNGINIFVRSGRDNVPLPTVVDIDSIKNATSDPSGTTFSGGASSIRINLPAGTYDLVPVGPAAGGKFTAIEFCNCNVSPRKYAFRYHFTTSELSTRTEVTATTGSMDGGLNYTTAEAALAGAPTRQFRLERDGWITLFLYDSPVSDNVGGVSVRIQPSATLTVDKSSIDFSLLTAADVVAGTNQKFWAGNSRIYELVPNGGNWESARASAKTRRVAGAQGYLATITSADEWNFIKDNFGSSSIASHYWIGASDSAVEGEWRWMDGPETGQVAQPGIAGLWRNGEPNNLNNEDCAEFFGLWRDVNDINCDSTVVAGEGSLGYLVEYSSATTSVGSSSAARLVTLRNDSASALSISGITISGGSADQFTQTNNCGAAIPLGGSCTISVTFRPTGSGSRSASLVISHGGSGGTTNVSLVGSGSSAASILVNVDSVKNATGDASGATFAGGASAVRIPLAAGTYHFLPIGVADGGRYTATEYCICNTNPQKFAWLYDYRTSDNSQPAKVKADTGFADGGLSYVTAAEALAGAPAYSVTLGRDGWIEFFIYDPIISDNAGGVSLKIVKMNQLTITRSSSAPGAVTSSVRTRLTAADVGYFRGSREAVYWPRNGHIYRFVEGAVSGGNWPTVSWQRAFDRTADSDTALVGFERDFTDFEGNTGYFATITSVDERKFIRDRLLSPADVRRDWLAIGAKKVSGTWKWVSGPEKGQDLTFTPVTGSTGGTGDFGRVSFYGDMIDGVPDGTYSGVDTTFRGLLIEYGDTDLRCIDFCTPRFDEGSIITLKATPAVGAVFKGWTGACAGSSETCTVTMDAAKTVQVEFAYQKQLNLSASLISFDQRTADPIELGSKSFTIANAGSQSVSLQSIVLSGTNADQFSQVNSCGSSLAAGASCTVSVRFLPTSGGTKTASLIVTSDEQQSNLGQGGFSNRVVLLSGLPPEAGSVASLPAIDAAQLAALRPGIANGVYWFDPDGTGGNAPFQSYADFTTAGGGWLQVRRLPGSGGWYSQNDDLRGTTANNPGSATTVNSSSEWSLKFDYFVDQNTEYLFSTGDGAVQCVIQRGMENFSGVTTLTERRTPVLFSKGTAIKAGGRSNVLLRSANQEDPWIGCEGVHTSNFAAMLYAEIFSDYTQLKNARNGINVFVRNRKPAVTFSETTINFGAQAVGTTVSRTLVLTNTSTSPVAIEDIELVDSPEILVPETYGVTRTVGPGQQFATMEAAIQAAQSGDTILIKSGTYTGSKIVIDKDLTIVGEGTPTINYPSGVGPYVQFAGDGRNVLFRSLKFVGNNVNTGILGDTNAAYGPTTVGDNQTIHLIDVTVSTTGGSTMYSIKPSTMWSIRGGVYDNALITNGLRLSISEGRTGLGAVISSPGGCCVVGAVEIGAPYVGVDSRFTIRGAKFNSSPGVHVIPSSEIAYMALSDNTYPSTINRLLVNRSTDLSSALPADGLAFRFSGSSIIATDARPSLQAKIDRTACGTNLSAGSSCSIVVTYRPSKAGDWRTPLRVTVRKEGDASIATTVALVGWGGTYSAATADSAVMSSNAPSREVATTVSRRAPASGAAPVTSSSITTASAVSRASNSSGSSVKATPIVGAAAISPVSTTSAGPVSIFDDMLTGSRYRINGVATTDRGIQRWSIDYVSNTGAVFASLSLPDTAPVLWRSDRSPSYLSTTGWVRACGSRIWSVQDGYELLTHVADRDLSAIRPGESPVELIGRTSIVTGVRCESDGLLSVEGYALDINTRSPRLSAEPVKASRFTLQWDSRGRLLKSVLAAAEFSVLDHCATPANEQRFFCAQAGGSGSLRR